MAGNNKYFTLNARPAPKLDAWDHLKEHEVGLGGQTIVVAENDATKNKGVLYKGCPVYVDNSVSPRVMHIVKSAQVVAGGTTAAPRVKKNHLLVQGDIVYGTGDAVTINSITVGTDYDTLKLSAACTGATDGLYINQAASDGTNPTAKYVANGLVSRTDDWQAGATFPVVFRIDEWVRRDRLTYCMSDAIVTALSPNIIIK